MNSYCTFGKGVVIGLQADSTDTSKGVYSGILYKISTLSTTTSNGAGAYTQSSTHPILYGV